MRKIIILFLIFSTLIISVSAEEITAPTVPEDAQRYMPSTPQTFGEGLLFIVKAALQELKPAVLDAIKICFSLLAICLLCAVLHTFSGNAKRIIDLVGVLSVGTLLIKPSNTFITLGVHNVDQLSEYGKLLLPAMTAAAASQGSITGSAALFTGATLFGSLLTALITKIIVPMLYIYLCLCIANSMLGEEILKNLRDFIKWAMTWGLKIVLYVFTGYIGITGVISGTADAAAVKAAKLALSGTIPVVGSIISDASETILVSASLVKNTVGVYGLLAIIAVWIGPFVQIGVQYLLLKLTASICSVLGAKKTTDLIKDFSGGMGMILAMTGTISLLLLISTVCFMKGTA